MHKLPFLIESQQLTKELIFHLFQQADSLRTRERHSLNGKVLATLFYEPSTRTRLSFESAMLKMGGSVISTENAKEFSSAVKGESIEDTIRIICGYADGVVLRHYEEGASKKASSVATKPIINAGDGKGQHPTQALLDAYTIYRELGRMDNFTIAMVGDLSNGRTIRSLSYLLGKFQKIKIIFVSPENLKVGEDIKEYLTKKGIEFEDETNLEKILTRADIVYMTRIQKERMSAEDYEKAKGKYIINSQNLKLMKPEARVMHPLPHVEEIDIPIQVEETDKRIAYFRQAENGLYVRMALLEYLMS
jgi:aspartate carbamoyltransferase catalytic subunit